MKVLAEGLRIYGKYWKESIIAMVVVTFLAFLLAYGSIYFLGTAGIVFAYLSFLLLLDTGRTYLLIRYSGEKANTGKILKRICIDSLFWVLFVVVAFVAPGIAYIGAATGREDIAAFASILGYYFLFLLILFYIELFEAGYRAAVRDEGIVEAIVNAEKRFRKRKAETVKRALIYTIPFLFYFAGNVIVKLIPLEWKQAAAQLVFLLTVLFIIPYSEAIYSTLMKKR